MHVLYGLDIIQIRVSLNLFPRVRWTKSSIGSGNGLAPNRRQAITWTNDSQVLWRIYAALGGKANPGYSIPDENLVDMKMYMFVCTHITHATQINIFGKYITIKQQWNLIQAANTGLHYLLQYSRDFQSPLTSFVTASFFFYQRLMFYRQCTILIQLTRNMKIT